MFRAGPLRIKKADAQYPVRDHVFPSRVEPPSGLEPETSSLPWKCSTTELRGQHVNRSYRVDRGAGDEIRTRDIQLGRLTLYQLSYSRGRDALTREMWAGEDSNLRRHKSTDLQSVPVGHFGTCPKNMHRYALGIVLSWRRDLNPQPAHYK